MLTNITYKKKSKTRQKQATLLKPQQNLISIPIVETQMTKRRPILSI